MRDALAKWENQLCLYTGRVLEWDTRGDWTWILLKNVKAAYADPDLTGEEIEKTYEPFDHVWAKVPNDIVNKGFPLERLCKCQLSGKPYQYQRSDGSLDWAISSEIMLDLEAVITDWEKAKRVKDWWKCYQISWEVVNKWEEKKVALCTHSQSTNEVLKMHIEFIDNFQTEYHKNNRSRYQRRVNAQRMRKWEQRNSEKARKAKGGFG